MVADTGAPSPACRPHSSADVVIRRGHALGVGRRIDDPEWRGSGVLGGAGRVGVERVALVQQRLHQLLEVAHSALASSARATVASNECVPQLGLAPASASIVSRLTRIQLPARVVAGRIISLQVATGSS